MNKKNIVLLVLLFCVLGRMIVSPLPINENLTTGADQGPYLHMAWFIKEHPGEGWDRYWYGGLPATLKFYPPGAYYIQALLSNFLSDIISFKLLLFLSFVLAPIAFYYLLKEFRFTTKEQLLATIVFSFVFVYNMYVFFGKTPALSSVLFGLIFMKFFIRSIKHAEKKDILLSSIFLFLTIMTHSLTAVMYLVLGGVYIGSVLYLRFDKGKAMRALLVYASGLIMSAYWLIPALLERKYSYFAEAEQSLFNILPFTSIARVFGYYINAFTVGLSIIATLLICFGLYCEYKKYKKNRNLDSLFLLASSVIFIIGYFLVYLLLTREPFSPEASVVLWPIILSMVIAKAVTKRILVYLTVVMIILQLVLFFGVPMSMQGSAEYTKFDEAFKYLGQKEGRLSIQPYVQYNLATVVDYRPPLFGIKTEFGTFNQGLTKERFDYIYNNFGFDCLDKQTAFERILSTDSLLREYIKTKRCELKNLALEKYFSSMDVRYVIVDKNFPEIIPYFETKQEYKKVLDRDKFAVFEFLGNARYIHTDKNISFNVEKQPDKIIIKLHSDEKYENTSLIISETWYPLWTANYGTITQNQDGFMVLTPPEINGDKEIVLEFKQPEFYKYLPILTFVWLGALVIYARKGKTK